MSLENVMEITDYLFEIFWVTDFEATYPIQKKKWVLKKSDF